jgi:hypothetical protein
MPTHNPPDLVTGLRLWTEGCDPHVRAAVELLIEHDRWLDRADFVAAAVLGDEVDGIPWIRWDDAEQALPTLARAASSTEVAILRLACDLAQDRYRLSQMGAANSAAVVRAITAAVHR